jgi:hypothetical protein
MRENKEKQKEKENRRKSEEGELKEISWRKERKKREKEDEIKCNLLGLTMNFPQNNVCSLSRIFSVFFYGIYHFMQHGGNIVTLWNCSTALYISCLLFIRRGRYEAYSCVIMSV